MKKSRFLPYFAVLAVGGANLQGLSQPLLAAEPTVVTRPEASTAVNANLPMDLARQSVGTRLQIRAANPALAESDTTANRSAQALIGDDASLSYPLAAGATSVILTLPKIEVLSRFNFISYEAAGQVSVSVSSVKLPFDSAEWKSASHPQNFAVQGVAACALGSVEARYVKIDFNTQMPGRIASLGLFGLPTISNFQIQPVSFHPVANPVNPAVRGTQSRNGFLDYASLSSGASVVATSRGGNLTEAQAILDGNVETAYAFDPADPAPTMVVDLGERRAVNRLSCVYQAPAGQLDVFLSDTPFLAAGSQRVSINYVNAPKTNGGAAPAAVEVTDNAIKRPVLASLTTVGKPGINQASADFGGKSGRYLIAAFHPSANHGDYKDFKDQSHRDFKNAARDYKDYKDYKDAKDTATAAEDNVPNTARTPFKLTAFSAFGDTPPGDLFHQIPPPDLPPGNGGSVPTQPPFPGPPQGGGVVTP